MAEREPSHKLEPLILWLLPIAGVALIAAGVVIFLRAQTADRPEIDGSAAENAGQPPLPVADVEHSGRRFPGASALTAIGSLLVLTGFALPWASCEGQTVSGLQLAMRQDPWQETDPDRFLLWIIPSVALITLGFALRGLATRARSPKDESSAVLINSFLLVAALVSFGVLILAANRITSQCAGTEYGILITCIVSILVLVGAAVSLLGLVPPRRSTPLLPGFGVVAAALALAILCCPLAGALNCT